MNVCWLAGMVVTFLPDHGTMLADLFYFVFLALQFTVPLISIFALLASQQRRP
jgi:hypothetical protein